MPAEPHTTALALVTVGALLLLSALTSRFSGRLGVPVALAFLGVGILAGRDGLGGLEPLDTAWVFRAGTLALVLILFDGGLNTPLSVVKLGIRPAAALATVGVVVTALLVAGAAVLLGMPPAQAALLGAVVSSTDAAAVFSVLRQSGIRLVRRVGVTLELESGLNDPMAVLLTLACTQFLVTGEAPGAALALRVVVELAVGVAAGVVVGAGGRAVLARTRLAAGGLYPVVTGALALLAFGLATVLHGSGFLAVYVAGVVIGNAAIPYRSGVLRVHDAAAWLAQVGMFLLLGLSVSLDRLLDVAALGLVLGLALALVARPIAVLLCLLPFRYPWRERVYVAWVGLRGAVPVILAIFPVLAHAPGAQQIFHLVFFLVVVNAVVPGSTIRFVTHRLKLASDEPPPPPAVLEVTSTEQLKSGKVVAFFVDKAVAAAGVAVKDLPFPPTSSLMVIVRAGELKAPRGDVVLLPGDHVYALTTDDDEPLLRLMFGTEEDIG